MLESHENGVRKPHGRVTSFQRGLHLADADLLLNETACPVCGYRGERQPLFLLQSNPEITLLACPCGCMSASRMPRPAILQNYYRSYYASPDDSATFDGSLRFARHLFRAMHVAPGERLRILDFGGGVDAALTRSLAQLFIQRGTLHAEITLVDYNASCRRDWGPVTVDCRRTLPEAGGGFDIVVAGAILEHIPYPREALLALLNSLRMSGNAYFRTPAMSSIIKLASRVGVRLDFTYPAHLHDMGQAFWDRVITSLGLQKDFCLLRSRPSIVETAFRTHPARTAVSYLLKAPWRFLGSRYTLVGGWEAVIARRSAETSERAAE